MKFELTDEQVKTLLMMIDNGMIKGKDAEEVVELKKALRRPLGGK